MSIVLMVSRQRSGTGALASVLERHADIFYAGEVLDPTSDILPFFEWVINNGLHVNHPNDFCKYFQIFTKELLDKDQIHLIDIKYNSLTSFYSPFYSFAAVPWILDHFKRISVPILNIKRNPVHAFVSGKIAEKSKVYHSTDCHEVIKEKIYINIQELSFFLNQCCIEDDVIDNFFAGYEFSSVVNYEECFDRGGMISSSCISKISDLLSLDLSALELMPKFVKQSAFDFSDKVNNMDELIHFLDGHGRLDLLAK